MMEQLEKPYFIPESTPLNTQLLNFQKQKKRLGVVVDEYGDWQGILTQEDVMETLLGLEIVDESDYTVDMQVLAKRKWEQRATEMGLDEDSEN